MGKECQKFQLSLRFNSKVELCLEAKVDNKFPVIVSSQVLKLNGSFPAALVSSLEMIQSDVSTRIQAWPRVPCKSQDTCILHQL